MEYLLDFVSAAETLSFSRAAELRGLSTAVLSKHIAALERELDVKLFIRDTHSVSLSRAGSGILPHARKLIYVESELGDLHRMAGGSGECISLNSQPVMAHYGISAAAAAFMEKHPDITVLMKDDSRSDSIDHPAYPALRGFALVFDREIWDVDTVSTVMCRDQVMAVMPKSHRLASGDAICAGALQGQRMIVGNAGTYMYELCVRLGRAHGFQPEFRFTSGLSSSTIADLVAEKAGITFMMKKHFEYLGDKRLAMAPLDPPVFRTLYLIRPADREMSAGETLFWEYLKEHARKNL